MSDVREYAVDKTTTDKLEIMLNNLAVKHRKVTHLEFEGGRDWVVVSQREPELVYSTLISNSSTLTSTAGSYNFTFSPPSTSEGVMGGNAEGLGVKFGVYDTDASRIIHDDGHVEPMANVWRGWIEDDARSWIIYLDGTSKPSVYWNKRDADGAVIGDPVTLG